MRSRSTISRVSALTAAITLVLGGMLGNALPAHAAPTTDAPSLPDQVVTAAPGIATQKPSPARRPAGPQSAADVTKGPVITLSPPAGGSPAAGKAPRMVDGAQQQNLNCTPYISAWATTSGMRVRIEYLAEIVCNFYLAGAGQAYLIERSSGSPYNGQVVAAAPVFSFVNGYYGYSHGAVIIDGRYYNGGFDMEIGFNLALQVYGGYWAGCFALPPGMRYLSPCYGLGTDTVSVSVGSGVFSTGMPRDRLDVLRRLTSTDSASYDAWNIGRFYPATYAAYEFDWSNDLCTGAPDNPLGFTFESACARHDFGYRNYKAINLFAEHKERLDLAFYEDLRRVCANYPEAVQPACYALAWVYYEAVLIFGRQEVTPEQIGEAAKLLPDGVSDVTALT
ncbi:phospholipase [Micromonospora sp. NPDC049900]|uniref:phospholipase n=1 Tax=Micromonospora sp. NPDC049900 TaxID=3364275 RepID=UPI0037B38ABD